VPQKNVPQPSNPLKSFNWSKLPDTKVTGTIWSELDDTKLYTAMELENIDRLFCAYQKNGVPVSGLQNVVDGKCQEAHVFCTNSI
jgi:dishevelled associated activator of morphogenesis